MNTLLHMPLPLWYALCGVFGLVAGSFLNVVIVRLPAMLEYGWRRERHQFLDPEQAPQPEAKPYNLAFPGSRCPHCDHRITALENIPIISYFLLRGRCSACQGRIAARYPLVEGLSALLTVCVAINFGISLQTLFACFFTWGLIALAFIDMDRMYLPDNINAPFLWLGLLCNYFGLYTSLHASLAGAALGYGLLWCVYHAYRFATGREGIGMGDLKLLAMLGAWTGWQDLGLILLLSSGLASLVGIYLMVFHQRSRHTPLSFGPYLALAGWLCLMWEANLLDLPMLRGPLI